MTKLFVQFTSARISLTGLVRRLVLDKAVHFHPICLIFSWSIFFRKLKKALMPSFGVRANGERFTDLCFADDIDIMSETVESAQSMLQQINDASSRYGMEISKEK